MKTRLFFAIFVVGFVAAPQMYEPIFGVAAPPLGQTDNPFDPVWAIMTRPSGFESMGCRGCHIGPLPGFGPWFGDTEDDVLTTLETGIRPDGFDIGFIPVYGGLSSDLGTVLHHAMMPLHGIPWGDDELAVLDEWLMNYE